MNAFLYEKKFLSRVYVINPGFQHKIEFYRPRKKDDWIRIGQEIRANSLLLQKEFLKNIYHIYLYDFKKSKNKWPYYIYRVTACSYDRCLSFLGYRVVTEDNISSICLNKKVENTCAYR